MKCIAFAGGGSGGHSYPLLAVAHALQKKYPDVYLYFVTATGSVEEKIYAKTPYQCFYIPSGKIKGQSILKILHTIAKLPLSFIASIAILWKQRPDFVLSAGGYAGAPLLMAAKALGIPYGIFEQNRNSGLANKWASLFSKVIFTHFPETKNCYKRKKVIHVGSPCRQGIAQARWPEKTWEKNLRSSPFHLFVFGGSQGAQTINRLIIEALSQLKNLDLSILHQTGEKDFAYVQQKYQEQGVRAQVKPYIDDMAAAYYKAHLVVCRSGASTLAELAAAKKAALLIPLDSKDAHQLFNAREMEKK